MLFVYDLVIYSVKDLKVFYFFALQLLHRRIVLLKFGTGEIGTGIGLVISDTNWFSQVHCRSYLDSKTGKWIYDWNTFFIVAVLNILFV